MIALASDFGGYSLKKIIMEYLEGRGIEYRDYGSDEGDTRDYPIFALKAAKAVLGGECERGILFCGTGLGMSIAANKIHGIRCACCTDPYSALMSREHNNANMLALGGRVVGGELAKMIVGQWLGGKFLGGVHERRLELVHQIEQTGDLK